MQICMDNTIKVLIEVKTYSIFFCMLSDLIITYKS